MRETRIFIKVRAFLTQFFGIFGRKHLIILNFSNSKTLVRENKTKTSEESTKFQLWTRNQKLLQMLASDKVVEKLVAKSSRRDRTDSSRYCKHK